MEQITVFEPADYIDSEVVAAEYLANARQAGDAVLLTSAQHDVDAARKRWTGSIQKSHTNLTNSAISIGHPKT